MNTNLNSIRCELYCPECNHQFLRKLAALKSKSAIGCPNCGAAVPAPVSGQELRNLTKAFSSKR